jgi:PglD N-terminal domain
MPVARASSRVIGLGAGGHAKVLIEIFQGVGTVEISGLLDVDPKLWENQATGHARART